MIEWQKIKGFESYEISSDGQLRRGDKLLRPQADVQGYKTYILSKDDKRYARKMHRLVLQAFVGAPPTGYVADHVNRDRADNNVENLRWASRSLSNRNKVEVKGVREHRGKFVAYAKKDYRWITLGRFVTFEQARACRVAFERGVGIHQ